MLGGVNNGWAVAMSLLGFERGEAAATGPIRYEAEFERLFALAREYGVADDPVIRQRLAWCYSKVRIMRFLGQRTLTKFLAGHHPGPDGAISKLYWSEYHRKVTELAVDILGADALVPTGRPPSSAFQTDDPGAPELLGVVGRHVPQRPGRHDLRRVVADPAQHHRRDDPRPAEGAATLTGWPANVAAVAARPTLWATGVRQLVAHAAPAVGGVVRPTCRGRRRSTSASGCSPSTATLRTHPSPPMW